MQVVGRCAKLQIDGTQSSGSAGRPFTKIKWSITQFPGGFDGDLAGLVANITSLRLEITIAGRRPSFFPDGVYLLRLTVENWHGLSSSAEISIYRNASSLLEVDFLSPITIPRSSSLSLEGYVSNICEVKDVFPCEYSWTIDSDPIAPEGRIMFNQRRLYVPEYFLSRDSHVITLDVTCDRLSSKTSRTLTVSSNPQKPLVFIDGGDRTVSSMLHPSTTGDNVVLSAQRSWNKDYAPDSEASWQSLEFTWSCRFRQSENQLGYQRCSSKIYSSSQSRLTLFLPKLSNTSMVLIFTVQAAVRASSCVEKSSIFVPGSSQDVSNCPVDPHVDSSEASVQINITQDSVPVVRMMVLSKYDAVGVPSEGNIPARTVFILSSSAPIRIVGTVAKSVPSMSFVSIAWTLEDEPSVTCMSTNDWCNPKNLLTHQCVSKAGHVDEFLGQCGMNNNDWKVGSSMSICMDFQCTYGLGIDSSVFSGASGTYRLRLSALTQDGHTGSAAINIRFKPGPTSGYIDVSPMEGKALSNVFTITASYWQDFDETGPPLTYSFSYREKGCFELACHSIIKTHTLSNVAASVFPPGNITVITKISDSLGASTAVDTHISVLPPELSFSALNFSIRSLISNSKDDVEGVVAGVSSAAKTLNYLNRVLEGNAMQVELEMESSLRSFLIETLTPYILLLGQTQKVPPAIVVQFTSALISTLENHAAVPRRCLSLLLPSLRILAGSVLNIYKNYPAPLFPDSKMQPIVEEAGVLSKQIGNAVKVLISILQFLELHQSSTSLVARRLTRIQQHGRKISFETAHVGNLYMDEKDWFLSSSAEKISFLYIDGLFELISQVSALSIANSIPNQSPISLSFNPFLQIVTQRFEGSVLSGQRLILSRAQQGYPEINDPCLLSYNIEACCFSRVNGSGLPKCCFGESCSNWTKTSWIFTPVIAILPSKVEYSSWAYEAQISLVDSSLFDSMASLSPNVVQKGSTVHLVSGSDAIMVQIRQFHSNIPLPQQFYKSPAIMRLPLASQNIGVGCVTWDETEKKWSIAGLLQSKNVSSVKTFCTSHASSENSSLLAQARKKAAERKSAVLLNLTLAYVLWTCICSHASKLLCRIYRDFSHACFDLLHFGKILFCSLNVQRSSNVQFLILAQGHSHHTQILLGLQAQGF